MGSISTSKKLTPSSEPKLPVMREKLGPTPSDAGPVVQFATDLGEQALPASCLRCGVFLGVLASGDQEPLATRSVGRYALQGRRERAICGFDATFVVIEVDRRAQVSRLDRCLRPLEVNPVIRNPALWPKRCRSWDLRVDQRLHRSVLSSHRVPIDLVVVTFGGVDKTKFVGPEIGTPSIVECPTVRLTVRPHRSAGPRPIEWATEVDG